MSTTDVGSLRSIDNTTSSRPVAKYRSGVAASIRTALAPLASLRLTVVLFALSMVLVLVGTLAQRHYDIWYVVNEYFRTDFAWVELRAFFPSSSLGVSPQLKFPFPGGWLIGGLLTVNLLAAHLLRFRIAANGMRLKVGLAASRDWRRMHVRRYPERFGRRRRESALA